MFGPEFERAMKIYIFLMTALIATGLLGLGFLLDALMLARSVGEKP